MAEPASVVADPARPFEQTVASFVKEHRLPDAAAASSASRSARSRSHGSTRWRDDGEGEERPALTSGRYPVVALKMSLLPKLAGQSCSGHGAGNTRCPAVSED